MRLSKRTALFIMIFCVFFLVSMTVYINSMNAEKTKSSYEFDLVTAPEYGEPLEFIEEDYTVKEGFVSHMPVVILDMQGQRPPETLKFNMENNQFELVKGVEPYVTGKLSLMDSGKLNHLSDIPVFETDIMIKRRGNSSMVYDKPQYLVKLKTVMGQDKPIDLLNMGANDEWILNGSMSDKSMMRNYMCYKTASKIMEYVPDSRYCEVIIKDDDSYTYQGVYLLCENIRQGKHRVEISEYANSSVAPSFLVRRDRFDEEGLMLKTYLAEAGLTDTQIGLVYPSKNKISEQNISYIEKELYKIETTLYSENFNEFSTYSKLIDVDSFVDYFIINEFFGNYDAGQHSTYFYKEKGEPLKIGPVWDFDGAIDNYQFAPMNTETLAFYIAPWFERLITDETFIRKVEKRYVNLRQSVLSDESMEKLIEDVRGYLGASQVREWKRWEEQYTGESIASLTKYLDSDKDMISRETTSYEQELYRLKTVLRRHGESILKNLKLFREDARWDTFGAYRQNIIFTVCLSIFFFTILFVNRRDK